MATVYRAEDLSLKTTCAIKENLDYWDDSQRQFEREALILAGLRHPNLPRVTDYFLVPAQGQYLVMDFVSGYDLQQVIDRTNAPIFVRHVLIWADQICDALAYLHAQRPPIVHRDVKPANIRVTQEGTAMLVDFGVAKVYTPNVKTTTAARAITAGYSPVEQYSHGATDTRTDIYSLGATIYMLLTAQRPPEATDRATGTAELPGIRSLNREVTPLLEQIIFRAMEIAPDKRFATVVEFRQALQHVAEGGGKAGAAASTPVANGPPAPAGAARANKPGGPAVEPPRGSPSGAYPHPAQTAPAPVSYKKLVQIDWIPIPRGEFLFGRDKHRLELPGFQIARLPVTNEQYRFFLLANPGRPAPKHWKGNEFPLGKARHPVVGVSYHDALAFCEWLGCRLLQSQEWEKAARGVDGRTFPWGEDWVDGKYCNNWNAGLKGTTPVDRFPDGASPYGVLDMAGNVWEWTDTEYQGPHLHEVCGGSWRSFGQQIVQPDQRDYLTLEDSRDDVGFRPARSIKPSR